MQVLERFEIKEIDSDDPVLKAKVEYLQDTGGQKTEYELKAFSVSIINLIKLEGLCRLQNMAMTRCT